MSDTPLPKGIIRSREVKGEEDSPLSPVQTSVNHPSPASRGMRGFQGEPPHPRTSIDTRNRQSPSPLPPLVGEGAGGRGPSIDPRLTALEPQEKRENRVSVFIDGTFALGVALDVAATLGLRIGQAITPERLEQIAQAEMQSRAREDAYRLLTYRSRSEKEMSDRLARKGYEPPVVANTIEQLRVSGFLNDEAFARTWAEGRGKSRGRAALAYELRQKGVDAQIVQDTLEAAKSDETEQNDVRRVAVGKVGEQPADRSREARARLTAFLLRRGFAWNDIRPVLTELYSATEESGDEIPEE